MAGLKNMQPRKRGGRLEGVARRYVERTLMEFRRHGATSMGPES
jgi:hypothetical protein